MRLDNSQAQPTKLDRIKNFHPGVRHERAFGPVSANAGTFVLAITSDARAGNGAALSWEWTVALQEVHRETLGQLEVGLGPDAAEAGVPDGLTASTVQLRGGTAEEAMHARALASTYIAAVDGMFVSVRERFLGLNTYYQVWAHLNAVGNGRSGWEEHRGELRSYRGTFS